MMSDIFTDLDKQFMQVAIQKAEEALESGNFPCGAVLTVNGEIIESSQNFKESKQDRYSHAEMLLYIRNSSHLKKAKKQGNSITVYTTLEPCLMCFGAACIHRVDDIIAATPDPIGNMSKINGNDLGEFYSSLPKITYGLLQQESIQLIVSYLKNKKDKESLDYANMFSYFQSEILTM